MVQKGLSEQVKFLTFTVTFTLNTAIQYFYKILWLMTICQKTTFSCKRIVSSEGIAEIHILITQSLTVIFPLQQIRFSALHAGHDDAPP